MYHKPQTTNHKLTAFLIITWLFFALGVRADPVKLMFMLSGADDAPTPDEVTSQFVFSASQQPIESLLAGQPLSVTYLLKYRAYGDFRIQLEQHPNAPRSQMERYLVADYSNEADAQAALLAFEYDPYVIAAYPMEDSYYSSTNRQPLFADGVGLGTAAEAINALAAQQINPGHAPIGMIDNGVQVDHPALLSFDENGNYLGGNFDRDAGEHYDLVSEPNNNNEPRFYPRNVDEKRAVLKTDDACDLDGDGLMVPDSAGHGTHVAGLIAGQAQGGFTGGICLHCQLGVIRVSETQCAVQSGEVRSRASAPALFEAMQKMVDVGRAVVNMSAGLTAGTAYPCETNPDHPACKAMNSAASRQVLFVAASGNNKAPLDFPARDDRVVAAGGLDHQGVFWDEQMLSGSCPYAGTLECGSNVSWQFGPKQELTVVARSVFSLFYQGESWNSTLHCSDDADGQAADGLGLCTGTSMAAPQLTGLYGLLRSSNPLLVNGNPFSPVSAPGIRDAVVYSASQSQAGLEHDAELGYGLPDAKLALQTVLGTVRGKLLKNHLTPLFSLYGNQTEDHVNSTFPSIMVAFTTTSPTAYLTPVGPGVGMLFPAYPPEPGLDPPPEPTADVYLFTTPNKVQPQWPDLMPVFRMDFIAPHPPGCDTDLVTCNGVNRDSILAREVELDNYKQLGYTLAGREGYVMASCSPEPECIPSGVVKLIRRYNPDRDDHAVFPESQLAVYTADGYSVNDGIGTLGYVYPNIDTDHDGLIDGLELLRDTLPYAPDSNCNGLQDGEEFPLITLQIADPLPVGSTDFSCIPGEILFSDSMEIN